MTDISLTVTSPIRDDFELTNQPIRRKVCPDVMPTSAGDMFPPRCNRKPGHSGEHKASGVYAKGDPPTWGGDE